MEHTIMLNAITNHLFFIFNPSRIQYIIPFRLCQDMKKRLPEGSPFEMLIVRTWL